MTIDDAITIFHGLECNPLFSEKHFKAFDMAIASLEAWEKVRAEIIAESDNKSNNMQFNLGLLAALAIINKHLQKRSDKE